VPPTLPRACPDVTFVFAGTAGMLEEPVPCRPRGPGVAGMGAVGGMSERGSPSSPGLGTFIHS